MASVAPVKMYCRCPGPWMGGNNGVILGGRDERGA